MMQIAEYSIEEGDRQNGLPPKSPGKNRTNIAKYQGL